MTRIIGIVSGKGGVGKTTLTSNLGAALSSEFGKKVAVIDANVTTSHLGLQLGLYFCPITLNNVLRGENTLSEATYTHASKMQVIPASLNLNDLKGVDILKLKSKIKKMGDDADADIIILDSAPSLGKEAVATLQTSDEILFVTHPTVPAITDIIRCKEVLKETGAKILGLVINRSRGEKFELTPEEISGLTEIPILAIIPEDKSVLKSEAMKMPVVMFDEYSNASSEIMKLAAFVAGVDYIPRRIGRFKSFMRVFKSYFGLS